MGTSAGDISMNMSPVVCFLVVIAFLTVCVIGGYVTWRLAKPHYDRWMGSDRVGAKDFLE